MSFLDKLFRIDARAFKKIQKKASRVFSYEEEFKKKTDSELQARTPYLKKKYADCCRKCRIYQQCGIFT